MIHIHTKPLLLQLSNKTPVKGFFHSFRLPVTWKKDTDLLIPRSPGWRGYRPSQRGGSSVFQTAALTTPTGGPLTCFLRLSNQSVCFCVSPLVCPCHLPPPTSLSAGWAVAPLTTDGFIVSRGMSSQAPPLLCFTGQSRCSPPASCLLALLFVCTRLFLLSQLSQKWILTRGFGC